MFGGRWKSLFGGSAGSAAPAPARVPTPPPITSGTRPRAPQNPTTNSRRSPGLEQFFYVIRDTAGLSLLDLSAASQANISFITGLGHRIYAEDIILALDGAYYPPDSFFEAQQDEARNRLILDQCLNFPSEHFDGALVWDCLQYMAPPLIEEVVERLWRILRPNAYVLAFFSSDERAATVPRYLYRIADGRTLLLTPQEHRPPSQHFNSRHLERLFGRFQQVKFFLARDNLREVLVKR